MAGVYDNIDVRWSWNGDILPGDDGDLKTTADNTLQSLLDQISIIVGSSLSDWELYPNRAASIDELSGEPNTRETGDKIHDRVKLAIVSAGLVDETDIEVRVFPIHQHKVMIIIQVDAVPSAANKLQNGDLLQTALVFDTVQRQVLFFKKPPAILGGTR